ncbi:MAG TPA: hypothetical protein VMX17_11990 [Candidatus Glassbacteria bacterium]|nr:hypothetical protein [Candidatus Glassbacteria bacterium]
MEKIKVHMLLWYGNIPNLPSWFKDREDGEITIEQIKELYDSGVNVMLKHYKDDPEVMLLAVDTARFNQR